MYNIGLKIKKHALFELNQYVTWLNLTLSPYWFGGGLQNLQR